MQRNHNQNRWQQARNKQQLHNRLLQMSLFLKTMSNNKIYCLLIISILVLSCTNKSEKKLNNLNEENNVEIVIKKIHLNISNIPKIQHRVKIEMNGTRTDKSPAFTYKTFNNTTVYEIEYDKRDSALVREFDLDTIFLKLRYNPGKSITYILRRGDSAHIDYLDEKPILNLKNRVLKKNDLELILQSAEFDSANDPMNGIFNPFKLDRKKRIDKMNESYDKVLFTIDSLCDNDLISDAEYSYFQKKYAYKKAANQSEFDINQFKNEDLHIKAFTDYLRKFVFENLKVKTVSLGNGMARNFLEIFDFVYSKDYFSKKSKKYLLKEALKNIKIDHSKSTFDDRLEKYNLLFPEDKFKDDEDETSSILGLIQDVQLTSSNMTTKTLAQILNQNKGKIVFIDLWASWCAPCIDAFSSYEYLKKTYSQEEIVFVFISVDTYENKWIIASDNNKLTNSYLATNYPEAKFYQELNIRSFPRYLLFNQEGELTESKAPAPDGDLLKAFLDELLIK
jgi:thiol-disulfide isomerase/thioredoxin